jgi:GDP-L-fucose synthase
MSKQTVLVTGGSGFLGRHVVQKLRENPDLRVAAIGQTSRIEKGISVIGCDLTNPGEVDRLFRVLSPGYVYHLAGYNGGIEFNRLNPARIFHDNTLMALNILEACKNHKVTKLLSVVASCAYPSLTLNIDGELVEREFLFQNNFLDGEPHPSVACHAYAKRNLYLASRFYREQHNLNAICVCPTTLYGPGDSFDPQRTKVMAALVKRFVDAADEGLPSVTCWGTGNAWREFLYVADAADCLVYAMDHYNHPELLNLGTGQELLLKSLVRLVARIAGFSGEIYWDHEKPTGQIRKCLVSNVFANRAFLPLEQGIEKTVAYYRNYKLGHERAANESLDGSL